MRQVSLEPISLLIAQHESTTAAVLDQAYQAGFIDRLLFAQVRYDCEELYCLEGPTGMLCHSSSLLASVVTLLREKPRTWSKTSMKPIRLDPISLDRVGMCGV